MSNFINDLAALTTFCFTRVEPADLLSQEFLNAPNGEPLDMLFTPHQWARLARAYGFELGEAAHAYASGWCMEQVVHFTEEWCDDWYMHDHSQGSLAVLYSLEHGFPTDGPVPLKSLRWVEDTRRHQNVLDMHR